MSSRPQSNAERWGNAMRGCGCIIMLLVVLPIFLLIMFVGAGAL